MEDLQKNLKELQLREKKLKNRTIWVVVLTPIITIIISVFTTYLTINKELRMDRLDYTQEHINSMLLDSNLAIASKKLKFLLDADLIGDKETKSLIVKSLNKNLTDSNASVKYFISGALNAGLALNTKNKKAVADYYLKAVSDLSLALEFDPKNYQIITEIGRCYNNIATEFNVTTYYEKAIIEYDKALKLVPMEKKNSMYYYYIRFRKIRTLEYLERTEELCTELNSIDTTKLGSYDLEGYRQFKNKYCDKE